MKLNKLALTLTAAALLPTFAHAGSDDAVTASFERDLQRSAGDSFIMLAQVADPLNIVNAILNKEADVVVASFDRDLYHAPVAAPTVLLADAADPLDSINVAFRSEPGILVASFARDLHRVPTVPALAVSGQYDPLTDALQVALWSETDKPTVNFAMRGKHHHGS